MIDKFMCNWYNKEQLQWIISLLTRISPLVCNGVYRRGLAASKSKNLYMVFWTFYVLSGTNTARSDTEMR